jgi:catechol 2,3-dioxygenase-like lactoylglutathione lyase family enzyme
MSALDEDGFMPEINAITLATTNMAAAVTFYQTVGMTLVSGGPEAPFSSLRIGRNFVNLTGDEGPPAGFWGRAIFHVASPDALWRHLSNAGYVPSTTPRDAPWGERYFHILDPDGHELSFARRLPV